MPLSLTRNLSSLGQTQTTGASGFKQSVTSQFDHQSKPTLVNIEEEKNPEAAFRKSLTLVQ
jgi:hypothetical protein